MTSNAISRFPAVLIGGPPHAGKSVLAYNLKQALHKAGIQCYLLRAAPDGEGDWSQEIEPALAQELRDKGQFTPDWITSMCRDIARRPLPFLVDAGGQPRSWDEAIFDQCTHAIILSKDPETHAFWQDIVARYNLVLLADLTSQLSGEPHLETESPVLKGTITNLTRGQETAGPVFDGLLFRVKSLFGYDYTELLKTHEAQAPTDLVVDLPYLYRRLFPNRHRAKWSPQDLPQVFKDLPQDTALALYGVGPAWLYAAVAARIYPHPFYQFDARQGWIAPPEINTETASLALIDIQIDRTEDYIHLDFKLIEDYMEYRPEVSLSLPEVSEDQGVLLGGKIPTWLYTAVVRYYCDIAPWIAIYYPHLDRYVVVYSRSSAALYGIGNRIQVEKS